MKIKVNGEVVEIVEKYSIGQFLDAQGLDMARVVIELNKEIVDNEALYRTILAEGDTLEIVGLVGGGSQA